MQLNGHAHAGVHVPAPIDSKPGPIHSTTTPIGSGPASSLKTEDDSSTAGFNMIQPGDANGTVNVKYGPFALIVLDALQLCHHPHRAVHEGYSGFQHYPCTCTHQAAIASGREPVPQPWHMMADITGCMHA